MKNNIDMYPEKMRKIIATHTFNGCAHYHINDQSGYHGVIPEKLASLRTMLHGTIYGDLDQGVLTNEY